MLLKKYGLQCLLIRYKNSQTNSNITCKNYVFVASTLKITGTIMNNYVWFYSTSIFNESIEVHTVTSITTNILWIKLWNFSWIFLNLPWLRFKSYICILVENYEPWRLFLNIQIPLSKTFKEHWSNWTKKVRSPDPKITENTGFHTGLTDFSNYL